MVPKKRRTVMSVNRNIDTRLDRSGMSVDRDIGQLMKRGRKAAISRRTERKKSVFEIGDKNSTLLGLREKQGNAFN